MDGAQLTHLDAAGNARMVDVSEKQATDRFARARAVVRMSPAAAARVAAGDNPKGDVAAVARIAGIQAAKRTDELIPLAHSLPLTHVDPAIEIDAAAGTVTVIAETRTRDRTGVEMEALVACSVAALTVYDMVKGIEPGVVIERIELLDKTGGKADFHGPGRLTRPPNRRARTASGGRREPLMDGHGRPIGDLRISVTDRCNFRCQYCMPAEGLPWLDRSALLSYEEIERLVRLLAAMGVHDVRLTGGEPLVRKELWRLVERLSAIEDVHDLSLTTNGYLLARQVDDLVAAGLRRVNVSLDSLAPDRFFQLTRRNALAGVLEGLEAAQRHESLRPIKVNVVALRDFTEQEVVRFAEFARENPYEVRFIEFMPLDADRTWTRDKVLPNAEIRDLIHAAYPLEPVGRERHGTARRYRFADGRGDIGFISPVSAPFCGDCNRIRLTAEGELRTCLFSMTETDLREPLRSGASDAELETIIRDAVWAKELKHHVNDPGFVQPARTMSRIGG